MRQGYDPVIVFDKRGEIFAISTGADSASEHEHGTRELQESLCGEICYKVDIGVGVESSAFVQGGQMQMQRSAKDLDASLVHDLRYGYPAVHFPELLDRKKIGANLDQLAVVKGDLAGEPAIVFGFSAYGTSHIKLDHRELPLSDGQDYVGAWDEASFAFKARGAKLVAKLERFIEKVKAGDGVFAGTFLKQVGHERLSGVVIALRSGLRPEHRTEIAKVQAEWKAKVQLKARSCEQMLYELARDKGKGSATSRMPGSIWPLWQNGEVGGKVVYGLNPYHGVDAQYYGPYTYEQLREWILADKKFRLTPLPQPPKSEAVMMGRITRH